MSEKKAETKGITINKETIDKIMGIIIGYYPMIKVGSKWMGIDIPPEIDELITAYQKGEPVDLDKLRGVMDKAERKVGEPVFTRQLAEEAWYLHSHERMGTRDIADYFTNERGCPCSHATVARWINMIDVEKKASKIGSIYRLIKIGGFIGLLIAVAYLAHLFW